MSLALPYLTSDFPGVGGTIKRRVEDFRVEEIPLYDARGEGTHVYFRVEKRGIPTPVAVERIARYMGVRPGDVGVAGLKDAQ
ncbi:MAG: tRNA pseudouridine(13) synthase TruD, partial [Phycisphaerae bacterium]|nr:tRNA pseudouridine(13) synthase TruD [Phycisphaerae bacterium]